MDKHFEPVTARSLADKIVDAVRRFQPWQSIDAQKDTVEYIIEPHIRKPSDNKAADPDWIAKEVAGICGFRGEEGDINFRKVRELVSPYIRTINELHQSKSVQERCEEAYNELQQAVLKLLQNINTPNIMEVLGLLNKPNPFKEADIVKEDETEPTLLPFSLEDAKNGAKVVTTKGDDVKIVADDLTGNFPLLAVVTTAGVKFSCRYSIDGSTEGQQPPMDLFILKEPEELKIGIYRNKTTGRVFAHNYDEPLNTVDHGRFYEIETIKTIKVTI